MQNYWLNKERRSEKARKHTDAMENRYADKIQESVKRSRIYTDFHTAEEQDNKTSPKLVFTNTDSVSALLDLPENGRRIAVVNFASYKNPGGMFLRGSSAQEESLCHESFLYNVLRHMNHYYEENQKRLNWALYTDRAIYSPDVYFMRGDRVRTCGVITCAAPNWSAASRHTGAVSRSRNTEALRSRIGMIRDIADNNQVDVLIFGAFGCGVFGQDPEEVARISLEVFGKTNYLKKVIFAVPGTDRNAAVFKELTDMGNKAVDNPGP